MFRQTRGESPLIVALALVACTALLGCELLVARELGPGPEDPDEQTPAVPLPDLGDIPMAAQASVVSASGFLRVPPPVCEAGEWVDYGCDAELPLSCEDSGLRIGFVDDDDSPCPSCLPASEDDPTTCTGWRYRYSEFLAHNISQSCASWCEEDSQCVAWEIHNACGRNAMALFGGIDEEPILFAEAFARENCGLCGEFDSQWFMRRAGADSVEAVDGATGVGSGLLLRYAPACFENQCVLVWSE